MSSILKALKKLEDEKATRRPDSLKIDSDILRVESAQRYPTTVVVLAALLLFAGGSIATYMYMRHDSSPVTDARIKPMEVSRSTQLSPHIPVPAAVEIKTEKLPEVVEIVPAKRSENAGVVVPKQKKQSAVAKSMSDGTLRPNILPKPDDNKNIPVVTIVQPPVVARSIPALRVNGIAFQDGATDSVAVVNGVPVSYGSMIEGAKVEIIKKDRVRFSYKGEFFDIPMGKSNR